MSIFKRGRVYWYHFIFNGQHVQESTKQCNPRVARQMEAAHRTSLAKGEVGLRERKPVPTLRQFITREFLPWAEATFRAKHKTFLWYRGGARRLGEFEPIASLRLDQVTGEKVAAYIAHRQTDELNITAINRELQILRRILRLSVEWGHVQQVAKIKMLPGETRRERVISSDEEARYLAAAPEPLASIATRSGHVEPSSIRKHHARTFGTMAEQAAMNGSKPMRTFVLYTLRHTFLTRLGQSGCDVWTLARIAGHSTIGISARYVHPSEDAVLAAIARLSAAAPARIETQHPDARPRLLPS